MGICRLYSLVLVFCLVLGSFTARAESEAARDAALEELFAKLKNHSLGEKIEKFSEHFLGTKYADNPSGEGPHGIYSRNPVFRTDIFDCTTLVETVMALSLVRDFNKVIPTLKKIRYRGKKIEFTERNHFPCADWIPNNKARGFLKDVTAEVAGTIETRTASAQIDKKNWYAHLPLEVIKRPDLSLEEQKKLLEKLHEEGKRYPLETGKVVYLPFDKIMSRKPATPEETKQENQEEIKLNETRATDRSKIPEEARATFDQETHNQIVDLRLKHLLKRTEINTSILQRIPSGAIINIVRPNWKIIGTHMNISHQGFVIQKPDGTYFRHVSRTGGERVKDVLLKNYLVLCLEVPAIQGINLQQIVSP